METRIAAKSEAPIGSYGILTQNQKQKLEISLPTFQENSTPSKRRETSVVETELQEPTNYLDILPRVPLQMIYEYLPVEDIVNTYTASNRMHDVAADKVIWKGKVLIMKDNKMIGKYLSIIREFQQLQGIDIDTGFSFHKEIVDAIRCYLEDLRFLKVRNMGFVFLNLILEKSENLEIIDVDISYDNFPDLLRALQNCTELKELHIKEFYELDFSSYSQDYFASWREEVTGILVNSFPSLTNIYLPKLQLALELKNIVQILQEKKNQLVNLSFNLYRRADSEALDIISSCERLNLDLSTSSNCLMFKLDKLKQLKSIKLTLSVNSNASDLLVMLSGIPMQNVKVLRVFMFGRHTNILGQFLEKLVMKFPMLQDLMFSGDAFKDINCHLSKLGNLTELRSFKAWITSDSWTLCGTPIVEVHILERGIYSRCKINEVRYKIFENPLH